MTGQRAFFGMVLILLGLVFLLNSLDIMDVGDLFGYLIPLGFIALGVWLIIRRRQRDEAAFSASAAEAQAPFGQPPYQAPPSPPPAGSPTTPPERTSEQPSASAEPGSAGPSMKSASFSTSSSGGSEPPMAIIANYEDGKVKFSKLFGDMLIDLRDQAVQNVEVSMGAGDLEIRLHGAKLQGGLSRMIVSNFLGDIRILVPVGMAVFAHCSNFIGDIEVLGRRSSGFGNNLDAQSADYGTAEKRLYIAANSFIGDIKIHYV